MGNDRGGEAGRREGNVFAAVRKSESQRLIARVGPLPAWPSIPAEQIDCRDAGGQKDARRALAFCAARAHRQGALRRRGRRGNAVAGAARVRHRRRSTRNSEEPPQMKSASESGVPGTRPEGVQDEREAAAHVREMFGRIAPRYDLLNHLLSLDIDKVWRRRVAKRFSAILRNPAARVLDLCCGTGDLALAFRKEAPAGAEIMGSDFVPEMLVRARAKAAACAAGVTFVEADALALPFGDGSFDLVSCAFGFRNLANYERGLRGNFSRAEAGRRRCNSGICRASGKNVRKSLPFLFSASASAAWRADFRERFRVHLSSEFGQQISISGSAARPIRASWVFGSAV